MPLYIEIDSVLKVPVEALYCLNTGLNPLPVAVVFHQIDPVGRGCVSVENHPPAGACAKLP